ACRLDVDLRAPTGELKSVSWVDADGNTLKIIMAMPGLGDMEMILSDQATALARFVPPEMFVSTAIPIGRSLNPSALQRVRYRLRTTNPDATLDDLPTTGMQTVVSAAKDKVILEVTRQSHRPGGRRRGHGSTAHGKTNTARVMTTAARMNGVRTAHALASDKATSPGASGTPSDDLADYLGANLMINTADPALIRLAGKAAGGEREPFALGDKLRRFVSTYVSNKNLSIGFATASEVGRKREGDCSEHGVLLAALGRINGLPSRVAVGLAYVPSFGGRKDIFGYHLWTQFHIDGRWVDFDAALRESQCSPTRIAFATSSLKDTGLADLSLPLIDKIGSIAIDILDTEDLAAPTP
ncbi:MAG: transglutaminase family protein, partial [Phycisphaerae bacterium]